MERKICSGQIYKHFKNKMYQIIGIANHSETGEKLVIYQQLYGKFELYARPYDMFVSEVDHIKYPEVNQKYRFELVEFEDEIKEKEDENETIIEHITDDIPEHSIENKKENISENVIGKTISQDKVQSVILDKSKNTLETSEEGINPALLKFLDADTFEEKHNVLMRIRDEITDRLINDIAISMDVTVDEGDLDTRFDSLLACVDMMAKFEVNR